MLKWFVVFTACIVLVFSTSVLAQGDKALSDQSGNRHGVSAAIGVASPGLNSGGKITGTRDRPFSAEIINETDQTLADGNQIHRDLHCKIFRDAEGRTRQEMELPSAPDGTRQNAIAIQDPLAGIYIHLEPENKSATLYAYGPLGIGTPVRAAAAEKAGSQTMAVPSVPSNAGTGKRSVSNIAAGNFGVTTTEVEQLGTKVIEGFTVTGTRRTSITPAGAVMTSQSFPASRHGFQTICKCTCSQS